MSEKYSDLFPENLRLPEEIYPEKRLATTPRIVAPGVAFSVTYVEAEGATFGESENAKQQMEDMTRFQVFRIKEFVETIKNINTAWNPEPWK